MSYKFSFEHPICNLCRVGDIKLPPKIRKRDRPKGAEMTIIGLPRKKKKENKPIPFLKKYPTDRENSIMCDSCLVWYHFKCTGIKQSPKSKFGSAVHVTFDVNL